MGARHRRHMLLLATLVLLPLGLLLLLGLRAAGEAEQEQEQQFEALLATRLEQVEAVLGAELERVRTALERRLPPPGTPTETVRDRASRESRVSHFFLLSGAGDLLFPPLGGLLTEAEQGFLYRSKRIWLDRVIPRAADRRVEQGRPVSSGWQTWYWEEGVHFLYWRRFPGKGYVGAELNRPRLLADLIGVLPATGAEADASRRFRLVDSRGEVIYQWGRYDAPAGATALVTRRLAPPLDGWRLQALVAPSGRPGAGRLVRWAYLAGGGAVALALVALGFVLHREHQRTWREAQQRVTFVNQVSHELKTPLTNIRMYAELLERSLDEADERSRQHLAVVIGESERLSRLINNVLAFARGERGRLRLRRLPGVVDECVREVLRQFAPTLAQRGVKAEFRGDAGAAVQFDSDAVAQILANLINNAEKYAAGGGRVEVFTGQPEAGVTVVGIADYGPGIPPEKWEEVFLPFARLDGSLTQQVTGTGIGLAIARQLARLHGGDLAIVPSHAGTCFSLTIHTPPAEDSR